ncbi:MAG: YHS domain-containing protein, partial [Candidatus Bathyarchaeia archaeon]
EFKTDYHGDTYYFCSSACRSAFEEDPGKYAKKRKPTGCC